MRVAPRMLMPSMPRRRPLPRPRPMHRSVIEELDDSPPLPAHDTDSQLAWRDACVRLAPEPERRGAPLAGELRDLEDIVVRAVGLDGDDEGRDEGRGVDVAWSA